MSDNPKVAEINKFMLDEFKANGFKDTTDNRISFLQGLRDGWIEDGSGGLNSEQAFERSLYLLAITGEISRLQTTRVWSTEGATS